MVSVVRCCYVFCALFNSFSSHQGEFDLTFDESSGLFNGHKKDQPENWRKLTLLRALAKEEVEEKHVHSEKGGCCGGH